MTSLRVITWNAHVGIPLRAGGARFLTRVYRPDVLVLQEAKHCKRALVRQIGQRYHILPGKQIGIGATYVCARKDRFSVSRVERLPIFLGREGTRYQTVARLYDRKTKRPVVVASVHVTALGPKPFHKVAASKRILHEHQVQAYADRMKVVPQGAIAIAAGDWNEHLGQLASTPTFLKSHHAIARMATARLIPAFRKTRQRANLDDVFYRPDSYITFRRRRVLNVPFKGNDHRAVLVVFNVR